VIRIFLTHARDARELYYGEAAIRSLQKLAPVLFNPHDRPLETAELIEAARNCSIIISDRMSAAPAKLFDSLPELQAYLRCAVDIRNVDVDAASRNGILVTHATPGFAASVSELIIAMMIDLARSITDATIAYRNKETPPVRVGRQLAGSSLGVIGYGVIGQYLCKAAQALGMHVLVSDPHQAIEDHWLTPCNLQHLLASSDFVVCLAVANAETENLMGTEAFAAMQKHAFFINASRGNLVDEAALEQALCQGFIAGAGMDVGRAPDQMPSPSLAALPNVIATPHIGGLTPEATQHQAFDTVSQITDLLAGRIPEGTINQDNATRLVRIKKS